jgi:hypothetical protein
MPSVVDSRATLLENVAIDLYAYSPSADFMNFGSRGRADRRHV